MARRYRDAAAKLQENVKKHLQIIKNEVSSSEDEEPFEQNVLDGVFQSYWRGGGDTRMLERTKNLLEESISGRSITCLICIGSIKRADAIWTCEHCYSYFHLSCIQKWSNDSISLRSEESHGPIAVFRPKNIEWCCPKCRHSYDKDDIPRKYRCFCGKTDDPACHPWLIPHTCGEVCGKRLSLGESCKHKCLLLCHPGPCPPCPQTVNGACFCGKERKRVRCSAALWSCQQPCKRILPCKSHKCEIECHNGDCPPCNYTSLQSCQCGAEKIKRPCNDLTWQCTKQCNKQYACGYHKCEKTCHIGSCGSCPNSGVQSCPCGSNERYIQCPDVIETCVSTCGKKHEDCEHNCPAKCHKGPCPPCQVLIEKKCQCSTHTRSLPCSKEFRCETKCRRTRPCGKHGCGRKCCDGNCPPCEKVCDKPLQCGRHKCTTVCHRGPCYPCPLESKVTCRCKETFITVPCGREKHTRPPKCSMPCKIKYKCGHVEENKHTCHFGDCPPCKAVCNKTYECGHLCVATCHEYVSVVFKQVEKPATPWEIQPTKTKIVNLVCPPCETPVLITCFGEHETDYQPCHTAARRPCGRECGRPLACGNHLCDLLCHLHEFNPDYPNVPYACKPCNKECSKVRPKKCTHKCAKQSCHPGPCPLCNILERIPCHCKVTEIYMQCWELATATEEMLSCKQQCPKNLDCGHRCKKVCHAEPCRDNQTCLKKAKINCPCGNLKKEAPCKAVRNSEIQIKCDESCEAKKIAAKLEREKEEKRLKELELEKNRKELEEYEWKLSGKKKKYKEKKIVINRDDRNWLRKFWVPILSIPVVILAAIYCIFNPNI
ncbi:NF-X1-type zinc finger protein NFXL1 [Maniola hyperantus]|uniref:NF-X1-type zinc finger protein NFXL1 n=1 Tax=Aphantopus hyperantus TaxID=2795564 RepID=UPI0015680396|nr:NF-X1-type zinc finger protein NFXL1 [Maniola hyperantus]